MEHTPGGQVFNNWRGLNGMYPEWGTKTLLDPKNIWEALSRQYANDVSGTVTYAHSENYTGVDGISQSVGLPDKFYGTIEYKVNDVDKISIPDWKAKADDYPYTGKAFTGSTDVVLPEYFQESRKFVNGDVLNIIDSQSCQVIRKFKYNIKFGWIDFN